MRQSPVQVSKWTASQKVFGRMYLIEAYFIADIDECREPNICGRGATCENTLGSHVCRCPEGFEGDPAVECWGK